MQDSPLDTPLQFVRGVGPHRAELLKKLGLESVEDLLWFVPRDYLDLTDIRPIRDLSPGDLQTVQGRVVDLDGRKLSGNRSLVAVLIEAEGEYLRGMWFNQQWMLKKFRPDDLVLFSGKPKKSRGKWEMAHPRVQWLTDEDDAAAGGVILPRYSLTEGLKMHEMRRIARNCVEQFVSEVDDPLPEDLRQSYRLPPLKQALRFVHLPANAQEIEQGQRCLIFHDLLDLQIALALRRKSWQTRQEAPKLALTPKIDARIRRLFPFQLTAGQETAVREIVTDLESGEAMHRLLQADVGAGKTAIAIYAMLVAVADGFQVALMAPTELLASQHWEVIERLLSESRVKRMYLSGQLSTSQRQKALQQIASGEVQLVVGTQALIQKDVRFAKLGLVVIDEQHRFGVEQRAHFSNVQGAPHVLVMTATPIPRSLCLTVFGDLDLSLVTELPPGRQPVVTSLVQRAEDQRKMWEFLREKIRSGRQAYVVCPRIEDVSAEENGLLDKKPLHSAEQVYKGLSTGELRPFNLGLIHGQMDRTERARIMEDFRQGLIQVLVSTTVIEVGVDVPNATLMVIYDAEYFGMSQLHQLRGRIGRGGFQGYCFLMTETDREEALSRLDCLVRLKSGFEVAEADFELRGPGDIMGGKQHGELPLRVAELPRDQAILLEARQAGFGLVESGRLASLPLITLKSRVDQRFQDWLNLVGTG
ncbi:MAG: ATP-dependent DNA helicase RecG [Planctomycetales bacterium]